MRYCARAVRGRLFAPAVERVGELSTERDDDSEQSSVQRAGAAAGQFPELGTWRRAGAESAGITAEHQPQPQRAAAGQRNYAAAVAESE